jgi:acyl-coenzyme A thioesterase PaaI-like protein
VTDPRRDRKAVDQDSLGEGIRLVMSSGAEEHPRSLSIEALQGLKLTPRRQEARRLAAAIREVMAHLASTTAGEHELSVAADGLEDLAARLGSLPAGSAYEGFSEPANAGEAMGVLREAVAAVTDQEIFAFFDHSPLMGLSNPLAPPIVMDYQDDEAGGTQIVARVRFGPAYEGPPGCVHGGFIAASFDEVLGATQSLSGQQGMTAHLEVDYRSPTPLGEELRMRSWLDRTEGRKIWARAELHHQDRLCAEAEALFLAITPGTFAELLVQRDGG